MQSILAEYHRELMKQYNLFAIDSSYGTSLCSKTNTEAHLRNYLERNLSYDDVFLADFFYRDFMALDLEQVELKRLSVLTDYGGAVFRRNAAEAVKSDVGLGLLQEIQNWMQVMEINGLEEGDQEQKKKELDEKIDDYNGMDVEIKENQWTKLNIVNPTNGLEEKRKKGILKLVFEGELSQKVIQSELLIGSRMQQGQINSGNLQQEEQTEWQELVEKFLFQEYLLRYLGRYGMEKEGAALDYQIEYLIAGKEGDMDNLRSVANRICAIREVANAIYLMSNETKMTEIKVVAGLICTIITLPELTSLLEAAILLGWAYAESIYDVKSIMAGGRIPLLKDDDSWHYSLTAALQGELQEETQEGEGLSYEDYLRVFMMLSDTDTITARAMDMVEADIRNTPGNTAFRLDGCYDRIEAYIRIGSRRGYEFEITRQKGYN